MTTNNYFNVKLHDDNSYFRMHITHPGFKGRIRKRIGKKESVDIDSVTLNIKYELSRFFNEKTRITKDEVEAFVDNYVSMHVNNRASILEYKDDFFEYLETKFNNNTRRQLTKSTISSYKTAIKYFEEYIIKKRISSHPSQINHATLNNFYVFLKGGHNYRVKLHAKAKGFIKYLKEEKQFPIDPTYENSKFNEEYDNQCPEDDDIAIPEEDVLKLIELRKKIQCDEVTLKKYIVCEKFPIEIQERQYKKKHETFKKVLDCFLLMISTGMYYADISKSVIYLSRNGSNTHVRYRRTKNNSLCKAIPIQNDYIFISEEIIEEYNIKNGSNFPINISLTHFAKYLKIISEEAGLDYTLKNKMARKTFASYLYFEKQMPIHLLQILLGHKDVKHTAHYLRISDDNIANEVSRWLARN